MSFLRPVSTGSISVNPSIEETHAGLVRTKRREFVDQGVHYLKAPYANRCNMWVVL